MNILLIEPDKVLANCYASCLRPAGHQVEVSLSAQSALAAMDQQQPDLIVLELQMASHNGVEFIYELRTYPEWLQIPVIIHSFVPKSQLPPQARLAELGVIDYLYKPTASLRRLSAAVGRAQPIPA